MDQELFQNVKIFLEKEKGCSNVEDEVPIKEKTYNQFKIRGVGAIPQPKDFGHIDIVGGKFYKSDGYTCIELHCIEYKSPNDDIIKGIGQIFWYKFAMSKLNTWAERLFLYLMAHEGKFSDDLIEFCKSFGIGLLQVNPSKIITEIVTPDNQHRFLSRQAKERVKLECQQCRKTFTPKELNCPNCSLPLEAETPWFWSLFADTFESSSTNRIYRGVPDYIPEEVEKTPMLKKVFRNWDKVRIAWKTQN
ncbi:hypothetical protein DRJ00_03895 [Candidatus Aerophobetes bacterium]|uniref:Uncharacterized protein n=1 Tax=Aerophobetes bacterium TaxID=2030807 RepID=A0A497E4B5_UNCAE|nr:MAG: hypothetical protein DRJ00_03895 [Candidatus Aerophobetes bacterium]